MPALFRLANAHGDVLEALDYGARIHSLSLALPGGPRHVVLGYPSLDAHPADRYFMGAAVGRYANRIGGARFRIDGREFALSANEGPHALHGGSVGFGARYWTELPATEQRSITFRLVSEEGDQGFPGHVVATVRYTLDDLRRLVVEFRAETDAPTHVSLTPHAYFNLDGAGAEAGAGAGAGAGGPDRGAHRERERNVLGHRLTVASSRFTPTNDALIPTGDIVHVRGTDLDLREGRRIADLLRSTDERIRAQRGLDLNYVVEVSQAAKLTSSTGDLEMTLTTDAPGLQVYTGQHLRAPFAPYQGVCLEPQHFPDSPNQPGFPSSLLRPGECYAQTSIFSFRFAGGSGSRPGSGQG